jgi:predicted lactoylglutathione lyase
MPYKHPMVIINLPVKDLERSVSFYTALGFVRVSRMVDPGKSITLEYPPQTPQDYTAIFVALCFTESFREDLGLSGPQTSGNALYSLTLQTPALCDQMVEHAVNAGGKPDVLRTPPVDDLHSRSFEDLDGHVWQIMSFPESFWE